MEEISCTDGERRVGAEPLNGAMLYDAACRPRSRGSRPSSRRAPVRRCPNCGRMALIPWSSAATTTRSSLENVGLHGVPDARRAPRARVEAGDENGPDARRRREPRPRRMPQYAAGSGEGLTKQMDRYRRPLEVFTKSINCRRRAYDERLNGTISAGTRAIRPCSCGTGPAPGPAALEHVL